MYCSSSLLSYLAVKSKSKGRPLLETSVGADPGPR